MRTLTVRNVVLGEGMPKICVPVMGKEREEILENAARAVREKPDVIEWRADFLKGLTSGGALTDTLRALRQAVGEVPLLFTIRTQQEGGAAMLAAQDYAHANIQAAPLADMVDIQLFTPGAGEIVRAVQKEGAYAVVSSHDFEGTPQDGEMASRLAQMRAMGADIAKLAVMPRNAEDVLRLLRVTRQAAAQDGCPLVTMAMGRDGAISRLAGETFGSVMTFGSVGETSAPGQMEIQALRSALTALHRA